MSGRLSGLARMARSSSTGSAGAAAAGVAGLVGGALWALIAGFLKTKGGVNEIFAGLGLNFVAQGVILWLIFGPWRRPGVASMSGTEVFPPALWLPQLASLRLSLPALAIVCLALILTALILRYTKIGLYLKAIGNNPSAAYLFGLKPARNMVLATLVVHAFRSEERRVGKECSSRWSPYH